MGMLDDLRMRFDALRKAGESTPAPGADPGRRPAVPPEARAAKEVGMARGAMNNLPLVQAARRVAREMMANGPVTIEDVCDRMAAENWPVWAGSKDAPKNWKGSVFNDPCFVCVGSVPSRKTSSHGRHVRQWALKSWLRDNPMNGDSSSVSAFSLIRIYNQYMHDHAGCDKASLKWTIGRESLSADLAESVRPDGGATLFGVRVEMVDGVGAVLRGGLG